MKQCGQPRAARQKAILVASHDSESVRMITRTLAANGYAPLSADGGERALASIGVNRPDLILWDAGMPRMGGLQVCERLRVSGQTGQTPILFLSDAGELEEMAAELRLGAVDFILKPFGREELLARVRMHLEAARLRAESELEAAERTAELRALNEQLQERLAERDREEQALRESEERFRDLANRAPAAIWVTGPDKLTVFYNRRAAIFLGEKTQQPLQKLWTAVVHPDDLDNVYTKYFAAVEARRGFRIECRIRRANGQYRWVLSTGIPRLANGVYCGHIGTSIDITDLKRSHERLLASQKLESLGALAAGMAHDFNSLIGAILAESDLALAEIPEDSPVRGNVCRMNRAAIRASEVVNLLLAYAGSRGEMTEAINCSDIVAEIVHLLKLSVLKDVRLDVQLAEDLPRIHANAAQIRLVVLNLLINAAEALQNRDGIIHVATGLVRIGRPAGEAATGLPEGDYCRLIVSDTGCGMSEQVQARAFDPFYTTKTLGRGLGLAVVQGILRSHGGGINVRSASGAGSAFEVLLPCPGKPAEEVKRLSRAASAHQL
jgi:PAS domain S-box-containing protein